MERSLNAIENWFRGTRFLNFAGGTSENFADGRPIVPDPGPLSYRGPGPANFIYARAGTDDRITNEIFKDTTEYRGASTLIKVYPICGTDGYFSLQPSTDSKRYLVAVEASGNIVARMMSVDNMVDMMDAACWREMTDTSCKANEVMLLNKKYPGLVLYVESNKQTISIGNRNSNAAGNCWEKSTANTTLVGLPDIRNRSYDDATIRTGWNLSDDNRSWGPEAQRSYELQPTFAKTAKECAAHAGSKLNANGFVFLGGNFLTDNCRTKVGGYWKENRNIYDIQNHANLISGIFN